MGAPVFLHPSPPAWPAWIRPGIRPTPFCPGGEWIPPAGKCRRKADGKADIPRRIIVYGREACGGACPVWIRPGIWPMPFCPLWGVDTADREKPQKSRWESRYTEKSIVYGREACGGACPAWIATENTREGKSTALLYSSAVLLCPNTKGKKLKKTSLFPGNGRILIQLIGCRPAPPERSRTRTVSSDADIPSWKNGAL